MRFYVIVFLVLSFFFTKAQENYSSLTRKALETMWKAKTEQDYQKALDMYENAFATYPDHIDGTGLYKASVLASELKNNDKAFQYLTPLAAMKTTEDGYPGWIYLAGKYSDEEYKNLLADPRWKDLKQKALQDKENFYHDLKEKENEFYSINPNDLKGIQNPEALYKAIRNFNPYQVKKDRDYSISFKINNSATTSYFIHLPKNYQPEKKYALLFFLHGAVKNNALTDYQFANGNLDGWNRYYTQYADQNDVILVFPKGSKQYNWMAPDNGFFMVPEMLKQIKKAINIDDNKVFISGHSNGATGSFSYLMKKPTPFAGFYGFNTYPKVFTGGTFVENAKNRSFINFSTDEDYYYPPNANDDFTQLMKSISADYKEYRYNGFPHWFPQFDESEPAYKILFDDVIQRKRNPLPKKISWEFDDEKYDAIDWISNIKLDTVNSYQKNKELNFKITKWLEYDTKDSLQTKIVNKNAFDFPRKSAKIKAEFHDNTFQLETSNISSLSINISPEMVNLKKRIKIYVNGKLYFKNKIKYNREFMLKNFENNHDREQVWMNWVEIEI
ncbi:MULTISPECIES: alpha/beta hydrolase-fold protein [unclassified Chryseobacterium]|uniref:alpha/beta hydrolase-fold protein n=1 Tax=unclassified Chryseobacterium TaxID=2593645 RepID=UPI002269B46C|nr:MULTISPECIES: alpha/beta hydrolase-fold protein [unclassified Chryseobacterium]